MRATAPDQGPDFDLELAKFTPRQMEAVRTLDSGQTKFLLYGGALGGGKSYFLRWWSIRRLNILSKVWGLKQPVGMLACEDYPALKDRQLAKIAREVPPWLGRMHQDHKEYGRCLILHPTWGGGILAFRNLDDPSKYACYSEDTEILIRGIGFVPVAGMKVGDECFSLCPTSREMSWQKIEQVHAYQHKGPMLSYFSRFGPSYCVTHNHKMLYRTKRRHGLKFVEARDLPSDIFIPRAGNWPLSSEEINPDQRLIFSSDGDNGREISFKLSQYLYFLGIYLAEGSTDISRWGVSISQHNGKNHGTISRMLNGMGVNWNYDGKRYSFNNKAFVQHLREMGCKSNLKHIPQWIKDLPRYCLAYLFRGLILGDGTKYRHGKYVYVTGSPALRDDVTEIALKLGLVATCFTYPAREKVYPNGKTYLQNEYYHLSLTRRVKDTRCKRPREVEYDGVVYCPTVPPHHNVLIRHRGRIMFCGQSAEFAFACIDELTKNPYEIFDHVRTRCRWEGLPDVEAQFVAGTNPGSIGHSWVKQFWMDKIFPAEWVSPIDYRAQFAYVPSLADDNPHLDSSYWAMLETLAPNLRKAFRYGDWDVFLGQAFPELSKQVHACEPMPIPRGAHIYNTFDWGFGAPFSMGWWWVDGDGRVYRCSELYGWNGQPNQGLRWSDEVIATKAIEHERNFIPDWVEPAMIQRLCGPDCFQKKPDYKGGGQGPSTVETFASVGNKLKYPFFWRVGDPSRTLKIRQFHERIRYQDENGNRFQPMLMAYNTCEHFFRTVGSLIQGENKKLEDVDTTGEDHVYDESCHICMARPLALPGEKPKLTPQDKRIDRLIRGERGTHEEVATVDQRDELRRLESGRDSWEGDPEEDDSGGSDGSLYPTI